MEVRGDQVRGSVRLAVFSTWTRKKCARIASCEDVKKTVNRSSARIFRDLEGLHARLQLDKKVTQVN